MGCGKLQLEWEPAAAWDGSWVPIREGFGLLTFPYTPLGAGLWFHLSPLSLTNCGEMDSHLGLVIPTSLTSKDTPGGRHQLPLNVTILSASLPLAPAI